MIRFAIVLGVVTSLIMSVAYFWLNVLPSWYYQTISFLFLSTLGLYYYLLRTKEHRPDNFIQAYLITLVVKLLLYGAYVFIIVLNDEAGAFINAGFFMATYFIFTGLEIGFLYHKVNR